MMFYLRYIRFYFKLITDVYYITDVNIIKVLFEKEKILYERLKYF